MSRGTPKTLQEEFLYKKVYEFSYAALRISSSAKNREVAEILESKAFSLLNSVLVADYGKTSDIVNSIISISGLLVDGGFLHPANREILIRESESIELAIKALPKKEKPEDLGLNKIFSKTTPGFNRQYIRQSANKSNELEISAKIVADKVSDVISDGIADRNSFKYESEKRQSAIVGKMKNTENCRLNDIQSLFPDVSDRTLRYDIESLVSRGVVERIGSRRNSIYRLKRELEKTIELPAPSAVIPG